jgi:hypothetical protein
MEFSDFDGAFVKEQKRKRNGQLQTYFNPIEEYQEAMEEGSIRFGNHVDYSKVKAKKNESLKKDPIIRAMLEASKKPIKIIYEKDSVMYTDSGVKKQKEKLTLEGENYNLEEDGRAEKIIDALFCNISSNEKINKKKESNQKGLFDIIEDE